MYRYLVVVGSARSAEWAHTLETLQLSERLPGHWRVAYEGSGILAMHVEAQHGASKAHPLQASGVVLGQLFDRRCENYSVPRQVKFNDTQCAAIVSSCGRFLIDSYWGSYLTIIYDSMADRHHVFCDPIGTLPCYHLQHDGADIFFSKVQDGARLFQAPLRINRHHLTTWLLYNSAPSDETALAGLTRLPRGQRLTLSRTGRTWSTAWDPVAIAGDARYSDPNEAARALRDTTQNTVDALASCYRRITHKLSGGLDSSIVAGCLAQARSAPEITYLNLRIDAEIDQQVPSRIHGIDPAMAAKVRALISAGDERYFARLVANRWNVPLIEARRDPSMDLTRMPQVPFTASPAMYHTMIEMDDAELAMIANHGAEAFFSGQAGDSVLLATLQPLASIDYAYLHGITSKLWPHITATTALTRDSLWSITKKTIKHGLLRQPYISPWRLLDRPTLLRSELAKSFREEDFESNLTRMAAASSLPPGKRNHIQGIACAYHDFIFHSGERADHIDPLNSQPVWELMLRIPTYTVLAGGVSRGLARQAFADLLPPEIRKRQAKGTGTNFYQHIVRRNRSFLRDRLADGLLVQQGYLDRSKLLECLANDEPSVMITAATLLNYLAAEIWLQRVTNAAANVTSRQSPALSTAVV